MIDLSRETPIPFSDARKLIPGNPHVSTLHRWRTGVRGRQLDSFLCGGRRYTSVEAIARFLQPDARPEGIQSSTQTDAVLSPSRHSVEEPESGSEPHAT
jgi:hypothetical protein